MPSGFPASTDLNGSLLFHSGCCGASALMRFERESEFEIDQLFHPEGSVIVENRDP
jgi:hypothetical protein